MTVAHACIGCKRSFTHDEGLQQLTSGLCPTCRQPVVSKGEDKWAQIEHEVSGWHLDRQSAPAQNSQAKASVLAPTSLLQQLPHAKTDTEENMLEMRDTEVAELDMEGAASLAKKVWSKGKMPGNEHDENSAVGKAIKVLREEHITGRALLGVTTEELMKVGMKLGPAKMLVEHIATLHPQAPAASSSAAQAGIKRKSSEHEDDKTNAILEELRNMNRAIADLKRGAFAMDIRINTCIPHRFRDGSVLASDIGKDPDLTSFINTHVLGVIQYWKPEGITIPAECDPQGQSKVAVIEALALNGIDYMDMSNDNQFNVKVNIRDPDNRVCHFTSRVDGMISVRQMARKSDSIENLIEGCLVFVEVVSGQKSMDDSEIQLLACLKGIAAKICKAQRADLPLASPIAQQIISWMNNTIRKGHASYGLVAGAGKKATLGMQVVRIEMVQHPRLWRRYCCHSSKMKLRKDKIASHRGTGYLKDNPAAIPSCTWLDKDINEAYLWHGTGWTEDGKLDILESIVDVGAAPSSPPCDHSDDAMEVEGGTTTRTSKKTSMFGVGVYLADLSSKANLYVPCPNCRRGSYFRKSCGCSPGDVKEPYRMLLCRAALGQVYIEGDYDEKRYKGDFNPANKLGVDSVMGEALAPLAFREYILYDDSACYPEFIVHYWRKDAPI